MCTSGYIDEDYAKKRMITCINNFMFVLIKFGLIILSLDLSL